MPPKVELTEFAVRLAELADLHDKKGHDYAGKDEYENFYDSARQLHLAPGQVVEVLIATKQGRLKQLIGNGKDPQNESTRDTLVDRAVYSVIALILYDRGDYKKDY